ncbi:unnamed protein product, partial [Meganyctiphanes norvegica]
HNAHDAAGIETPDGIIHITRETGIGPGVVDPEDRRETLKLQPLYGHRRPQDRPMQTTYLLRGPVGGLYGIGPDIVYRGGRGFVGGGGLYGGFLPPASVPGPSYARPQPYFL